MRYAGLPLFHPKGRYFRSLVPRLGRSTRPEGLGSMEPLKPFRCGAKDPVGLPRRPFRSPRVDSSIHHRQVGEAKIREAPSVVQYELENHYDLLPSESALIIHPQGRYCKPFFWHSQQALVMPACVESTGGQTRSDIAPPNGVYSTYARLPPHRTLPRQHTAIH